MNKDLHELPNFKQPFRITFCPKCHVYGAKMDLRDTENKVIVNMYGKKQLVSRKYLVKCGECGWVERKIR